MPASQEGVLRTVPSGAHSGVRGSGRHRSQVAAAAPAARRARSAGGPPGVALEPRLPGRPSGASGRRGAEWSRAAAGLAGRELVRGGVAPPAARRAVGSWGSARWPRRCGTRPASPGRAWSQLSVCGAGQGAGAALVSAARPTVPARPVGPGCPKSAESPARVSAFATRTRAGVERAPRGPGMTSPGTPLAPLLLLSLHGE